MLHFGRGLNQLRVNTAILQILTGAVVAILGVASATSPKKEGHQAQTGKEAPQVGTDAGIKPGPAFRISQAANAGPDRSARSATIAYNSDDNEYLVVWQSDALTEAKGITDIYGQRLNGSTGQSVGLNFRISNLSDGGSDRNSNDPEVVYNNTSHEYLVVWNGSGHVDTPGKISEIYGQRLSRDGKELGTDFRISNTTDLGKVNTSFVRASTAADVAWNSASNQYLVVWKGMGEPEDVVKTEIYGQLLKANGEAIGSDFRISETTKQGDNFQTNAPAIAYSSSKNQYLVVWSAGFQKESQSEIWGRAVSDKGTVVGADFLISQVTTNVGPNRRASSPDVVCTGNEYLVVFQANILPGDADREVNEVCGQRIDAAKLAEVGGNDFRISNSVGGKRANRPRVAYDSVSKQYLVIWRSIRVNAPSEISGQRLNSIGGELGADFQISNVESLGKDRTINNGSITYNGKNSQYLVVWQGNALQGAANSKLTEIFGQQLTMTSTTAAIAP
jgi:hypothetical protein